MAIKYYQQLLTKIGQIPSEASKTVKKSINWMRQQIKKTISPKDKVGLGIIPGQNIDGQEDEKFKYGVMITFYYYAKWREKLPYFDKFPLVFPIQKAKGGFLGLNVHYLPPYIRAKLFDALLEIIESPNSEQKKEEMSYNVLKKMKRFNLAKPCIKHYLNVQLRSKITMVPRSEWNMVLYLPTEDFVKIRQNKTTKIDKRKVWTDSRKRAGL